MIQKNLDWTISISRIELSKMAVYTDRNWVFNKVNVSDDVLVNIRHILLKINKILNWNLNIISNESEDSRFDVIRKDVSNWIIFNEDNYKLSTQSAAKFVLEQLKFTKCYFVWNDSVWNDINNLWLETINISHELFDSESEFEDLPIIFWRPLYAIVSKFGDDNEISKNLFNDIAFQNTKLLLEKNKSKIVFCHTKPNCFRKTKSWEYREINLWYYFEKLINDYWLRVWVDVFDLWKWKYSKWDFFNMALWINDKTEYKNVLWIWDMFTDVEYTLINWWIWILVNSWDEDINDDVKKKMDKFKDKLFLVSDLSKIQII